ncbi:MAG TPA: protein kinase [Thermomicrobiales bacterium]|jgi:serine/threonine-protein kinase
MVVQQDSLVGRKIGRYHLTSLLGRGRGAAVYSAADSVIGRTVAIKILDRQHAADPDVTAQFLRDAATLSQLRHPNILPIYEFAQYDGRAYIVRQHTDGGTLRAYLREAGILSVPDALALLRPVATALDYAHRQGFVHGNLRPSNIVRTAAGLLLLTDFAVPGQEEPNVSAATTIVSAIDEPEYASPEQARQQGGVPSVDLYVLAVILYESVTGRPPFQATADGDSARNVLTRHAQAEPPSPREYNAALGPAVEATLLRALAKRPEDRYPTGAALLYALHDAYEQDGGRRSGRPGTGPLGQRSVPTVVPLTELSDPTSALATSVVAETAATPGERASAPLPAAANDVAPLPHAQAAAPSAIDQPIPATTTVSEAPSVALPAPAPYRMLTPTSRRSVGPPISRLWLVVLVGLLALCAGLVCGLFVAVW